MGLNHVGSRLPDEHRLDSRRPSVHGRLGDLRPGYRQQNLPTFVILTDAKEVVGGPKNWSSGFLPASYQGTLFRREGAPILDLAPPETIGEEQQRGRLDLLRALNRHFGDGRPEDTELEARLQLLRTGVPDAIGGARSGGPHQGIGGHAQTLRHG